MGSTSNQGMGKAGGRKDDPMMGEEEKEAEEEKHNY